MWDLGLVFAASCHWLIAPSFFNRCTASGIFLVPGTCAPLPHISMERVQVEAGVPTGSTGWGHGHLVCCVCLSTFRVCVCTFFFLKHLQSQIQHPREINNTSALGQWRLFRATPEMECQQEQPHKSKQQQQQPAEAGHCLARGKAIFWVLEGGCTERGKN